MHVHPRLPLRALLPALALLFPWTASSQESTTLNYAFATQLGSGIYEVDGRTLQIYRLGASIRLVQLDEKGWDLRLRIPLTVGFFNFEIKDVIDTGFPEKFGVLALVPAVELWFPMTDEWLLGPTAEAGAGMDFSGGDGSAIFAAGVRSLAEFPSGATDWRLGNRFIYSAYTNADFEFADDFSVLETGLDARRPMGLRVFTREIDGSLFAVNYVYALSPGLFEDTEEGPDMRTEWEVGATLGTVEPWKVLGIRMPRLGASYRFGTGVEAWRLIVGNPFPVDSPRDPGPAVQ